MDFMYPGVTTQATPQPAGSGYPAWYPSAAYYTLQQSPYLAQAQALAQLLTLASAARSSPSYTERVAGYLPLMNAALQQAGVPKNALSWDYQGRTVNLADNLPLLPTILRQVQSADEARASALNAYAAQKSAYDHDLSGFASDRPGWQPDTGGPWRVTPPTQGDVPAPNPLAARVFGNPNAAAAVDALPPWQRQAVYGSMGGSGNMSQESFNNMRRRGADNSGTPVWDGR